MPLRLDPFQNVIAVNWGGIRLIQACTFRVDYGGPGFTQTLPFVTVAQMVAPDSLIPVSTIISGGPDLPFSDLSERYLLLAGTGQALGFHEFGLRPIEDAPEPDPEVLLRVLALPVSGEPPGSCDIKVRFGFGPNAIMQGAEVWYASRLEFDLSPVNGAYVYPRLVPFIIGSQFQEIRDFNNLTPVLRNVSGVGFVADFGFLQLNMQRGTMAYLPPDPPPEE